MIKTNSLKLRLNKQTNKQNNKRKTKRVKLRDFEDARKIRTQQTNKEKNTKQLKVP